MELSGKTVFLLDHSQWMKEGSGVQVEIDWGGNNGGGGPSSSGRGRSSSAYFSSFVPPVMKSLWTCGIESVLEYSRVVLDLFTNERLLRFGLMQQGVGVVWLNGWDLLVSQEHQQQHGGEGGGGQQCISYIAEKLGSVGPPPVPAHSKSTTLSSLVSLQTGIKAGLEALSEPTAAQIQFMQGHHGKAALKAINKGRVICLTTLHMGSIGGNGGGVPDLEEFFAGALDHHNRVVVPASDHFLPILECEFVLISIHPRGRAKSSVITARPLHEIPDMPQIRSEYIVEDPDTLPSKLVELCATHHELVSTTVTGIPMKEEQNAQHSSNYDVKLWHRRIPVVASSTPDQVLKWSTPVNPSSKGGGITVNHCTAAVRITPVDVNGRPTTCLTSFLMSGRSVWLEMVTKAKGQGKTTSHLITSHGGEIWLHVIETARNVLEDPPSISEGVGGRVTDYRIPDFADLIRMNLLIPWPKNYWDFANPMNLSKGKDGGGNNKGKRDRDPGSPFVMRRRSSAEDVKRPIEMVKDRLQRKTGFWPMTISGSVLFSMAVHIESILKLMPQDKMTDMEKVECDKCIWSLMSVEARGDPPIPSGHHKKQKREEQWRGVYNELENFIRANQHSENHKKVLECFIESKRADSKIESRGEGGKGSGSSSKVQDMEKALATLANFGTTATATPVVTDSPASPPPGDTGGSTRKESSNTTRASIIVEAKGNKKLIKQVEPAPPSSLLSLWTARTEKRNLRVLTNTTLYSHLQAKNNGGGGGEKGGDREVTNTKANTKTESVK